MRRICVVTNNRADYSRLKTLLKAFEEREDVELFLFVSGTHLLSSYGFSVDEIERDGFKVNYKMHTEIDGRIPVTMTKSFGLAVIELSSAFDNFKPDIVVVHGDRFEAFAAATAASMMNITVAHIQGGEVSGTIDEHIRHAITKLAHVHFPSNERAKDCIVKLGEEPQKIFNFGCPASDLLLSEKIMSFDEVKKELAQLSVKKEWMDAFNDKFLLVIQHPVTTEFGSTKDKILATVNALKKFDLPVLMLWPNIDAGSEKIVNVIKKVEREGGVKIGVFDHLSSKIFMNLMKHASVMIGNSSAGVREACYFGTPVVNVGTRQSGRDRSKNVIDVGYDTEEINKAIKTQLERGRYEVDYLYGSGKAGEKIAEKLTDIDITNIQKRITF